LDIPITTRLKRAPKEKTALFKTGQAKDAINPDNPSATVGGSTTSPDIITNESVVSEDPNLTKFKDRCSKYGGVNSEAAAADGCVWSDDAKDPPPVVTNTQTTTPGEDTSWEGTLKTTTTGDVFNPWEKRLQSRSIKKEGRDIRRSDIKKARNEAKGGGTFDEEGNYTEGTKLKGKAKREYIKKARQKAKAKENKAEGKSFTSAQERGDIARASGQRPGESDVTTGQRDKMQGEQTKEEQIAEFKRKADLKKAGVDKAKKDAEDKKPAPANMRKGGVGKMKAIPFQMKGSMFNKNY
tara:strand:+ start:535 stop:1422 length:888 start_codon:yes stop_codon:yes gene_type:complete